MYSTNGLPPEGASPIPESAFAMFSNQSQDEIRSWYVAIELNTGALYEHLHHTAHTYILTAASNDVLSLMRHVDNFDGRSAAAAARTLLEHVVNFWDVSESAENTAERFMDHRHVAAEQLSRRRWHLEGLSKKAAKRERNFLDGLAARSSRALKQVLSKYPNDYKRQWARGSLYERAKYYGLTEEYEGYRILSAVIHGSSGGMRGLTKEVGEQKVHRLGPDMQLVPLAFEEGLRNFMLLCEQLFKMTGRVEADEMGGRTFQVLKSNLEGVRAVAAKQDRKMWPDQPPAPVYVPSVVVWPNGKARWFLRDTRNELMVRADPVGEVDISFELEEAKNYSPELWGGRGMIVAKLGAKLQPRLNSPWVPSASMMIPRDYRAF